MKGGTSTSGSQRIFWCQESGDKGLRYSPDLAGESGPEGQFRRVINTARLNNAVPAVVGFSCRIDGVLGSSTLE
jgi:hypothetical protein